MKMTYEAGDKVRLRDNIDTSGWNLSLKIDYQNLNPKIVTITKVSNNNYYYMKEIKSGWRDFEIIGIYKEQESIEMDERILSRWEILDIR